MKSQTDEQPTESSDIDKTDHTAGDNQNVESINATDSSELEQNTIEQTVDSVNSD